jgi:2-polyprenyl-3-methyl-5-hydroxy-6-metoxy-1,4-benzoquinol methylase
MYGKNSETIKRLISKYFLQGAVAGWHANARFLLAPLESLERLVPVQGRILDIGCGMGLFSLLLAMKSDKRSVEGTDIAEEKISIAQKASRGMRNVSYHTAGSREIRGNGYDAIILSDVLYLIPFDEQESLVAECRARLNDSGILLIKEIGSRPSWKYLINLCEEMIMIKLLHYTAGGSFYFRSPDEFNALLKKAGFTVKTIPVDTGYLHPHIIYRCRKETNGS